jgi:acetyl-CoA carboxylase biotin carboxyl carrier protein
MSTERIQELLQLMEAHDLVELELKEENFKVRLSKQGAGLPLMQAVPHAALPAAPQGGASEPAAGAGAAAPGEGLPVIESPIVGTFYTAPAPEADPFVKVGDKVGKETVVCIVEAMKVMNEVHAGIGGVIAEILVENGEAVEFGQPLFRIRTDG